MPEDSMTRLRFVAVAFVTVVACKPTESSRLDTVVGLEAGLDAQVRSGSAAPTFIALADWFKRFRLDNGPGPSRDEANVHVLRQSDLSSRLGAEGRKQLIAFIEQEEGRIRDFEKALAIPAPGPRRAELVRLLRREADDMKAVIEALTYRYGAYHGEFRSTNKFALLLASRESSDYVAKYAEDFYYEAYKDRGSVKEIVAGLDKERDAYVDALVNRFLDGGDSGISALRETLRTSAQNLATLRAGFESGLSLQGASTRAASTSGNAIAPFAEALSNAGLLRLPRYFVRSGGEVITPSPQRRPTPSTAVTAPTPPPSSPAGPSPAAAPVGASTGDILDPDPSGLTNEAVRVPTPCTGAENPPCPEPSHNLPFGGQALGGGSLPPSQPMVDCGDGRVVSSVFECAFGLLGGDPTTAHSDLCPSYAPFELMCDGTRRCVPLTSMHCGQFADTALAALDDAAALALAGEPATNEAARQLGDNRIDCSRLRNDKTAFVNCMTRSPSLIDPRRSGGTSLSGFSLQGGGDDAAAYINAKLPNCKPDNVFYDLLETNAVPVVDQGPDGACTGYAAAGVIGGTGNRCDNTYHVDPAEIWNRYRQPYMHMAAQAVQSQPIASLENPSVKFKVTKVLTIRDLQTAYKVLFCMRQPLWAASSVSEEWMAGGAAQGGDVFPLIDCNQLREGSGHAYAIWGYDETRQTLRLRNSWGNRWGNRGYADLPLSCLGKIGFEAYAFVMECESGCQCTTDTPPGGATPAPATPPARPQPPSSGG
jgi:hypothetical protein